MKNAFRRLKQLTLALWLTSLVGATAMVGGAFINDRAIHSNPGSSLATVTAVDWLRTTVEYQAEDGTSHSPSSGLFYPSDLGEGQRVWVTYAKDDPDLVTVEGRRWTLSIILALSIAAVSTILFGALWWVLSRTQLKLLAKDTVS